eukprot:1150235-Pelagomonas_calceolata.AAC.3
MLLPIDQHTAYDEGPAHQERYRVAASAFIRATHQECHGAFTRRMHPEHYRFVIIFKAYDDKA